MEINKTVIVASRWFLYYLTYIDDGQSNTNQVSVGILSGSAHVYTYTNMVQYWPDDDFVSRN